MTNFVCISLQLKMKQEKKKETSILYYSPVFNSTNYKLYHVRLVNFPSFNPSIK